MIPEYSDESLEMECTKENCLEALKKVGAEKDVLRFCLVSACVREDWTKVELYRKKLDNMGKVDDRIRDILNRVTTKR